MCSICKAWEKGELTSEEALKAAGEFMKMEDIHHLTDKILEKEAPMKARDEEIEEKWWEETHKGEA